MKKTTFISNIVNQNFNTIIFDLNGTITNSVSKNPKHILFRNDYIEDKIQMRIHGILPDKTSEALEFYMLDPEEYYKYRNGVVNWRMYHPYNDTTYNMLSRLSSKGYNLVLYTDCYMEQVKPTLQILQIEAFFNLIVSKELGFKKPSTQAYRYIAKKFDVSLDQVLMIANDYAQDLKPLQDIDYFKIFKIRGHTLSWDNGADFAPEFLQEQASLTKSCT